uniref:EGF-like domain-containing protein n=1 Tax=Parastrongyloides trichosuri TaxID=131310 RepID=A0A0N4Z7A0_PARTI
MLFIPSFEVIFLILNYRCFFFFFFYYCQNKWKEYNYQKIILFLLVIVGSLTNLVNGRDTLTSTEESQVSVHFADLTKGRILWILDQNAFPWIGSYNFLKNLNHDITTLLSVVDSSTGITLAECLYHNSTVDENENYVEFVWALSESVLQCTLPSGSKTISLPLSQHPRSFSVRIQANRGPKCMKDISVQNEKISSCPPSLRRNGFTSHHLSCGCPFERAEFAQFSPVTTIPMFSGFSTTTKPFDGSAAFPLFNMNFTSPTTTTTMEKIPIIHPNSHSIDSNVDSQSIHHNVFTTPSFNFSQFNFNFPSTTTTEPAIFSSIDTTEITKPVITIENNSIPAKSTTVNLPISTFTLAAHPCASFECHNNGTCVVNNDTGLASCICNIGYVGDKCEVEQCSTVTCHNEGVCRISKFNFEPYCECKSGTSGSNCEIIESFETTPPAIECEYECKNGGICAVIANQPLCQCKPGFVGPNCNVIDLCQTESQTCSVFGEEAECRLEDQSFVTVSDTLVNGIYNCLCLNSESQWTDCLKLALQKQAEKESSTTSGSTEVTKETTNTFNSFNVNQNKNEEEDFNLTEETITTTESEQSTEVTQPMTSKVEVTETESSIEITTQSTTLSTITTTPMETTEEIIEETSTEEEKVEEVTTKPTEYTTTLTTPSKVMTSTTTKFIPPVIETNEKNADNINLSSRGNRPTNTASATTWIIVIFVILIIMMLIAGGVVFVLRYIRRSRKLHGKYNPAKEEHAIAATYALPMQAVAKEERLI